MFRWLKWRTSDNTLVEADARSLVERLGKEDAYLEARIRQHEQPDVLDGNRPAGHWERVKEAIGRATHIVRNEG